MSDSVTQQTNWEKNSVWVWVSQWPTPGKWTLVDGSITLVDWTVLDPENYLLYLLQLMIEKQKFRYLLYIWRRTST